MIVLDASVLIAHLDAGDAHHERARELLAGSGADSLGASSITLAEVLVAPARAGRLDDARAALGRLGVTELRLGEDAPAAHARLRAEVSLKLPDCCVLLAAQEHDARIFSFDANLTRAAATLSIPVVSSA